MSGSAPYRQDVVDALREHLHPPLRPRDEQGDAQLPGVAAESAGHRSVAERAFRRAMRPLVVRFVRPLVTHEVETRVSAHLALQSEQDMHERRLAALETNAELLKTELRSVNHNLVALKQGVVAMADAIAPTAGLAGVPARLAELRERLNAVERRTRTMAAPAPSTPTHETHAPQTSSPVDYVGFERRFRGDPAEVQAITRDRYLEVLRGNGPVLDVGCGKGELVGTLMEAGVEARGIDLDPAMVAEAVAQGRDVQVADLNQYLSRTEPQSLGAIIATQVVEHLQIEDLVRFLELSASRLRPGGVFIAETPNPGSLIVLATHFILDPTHVRPLHPALMVYLCESAGFRSIDVRFYAPATEQHLALVDENADGDVAAVLNANFRRLNDVLFGPQDYAVVARTPAETSVSQ